MKLKLNLNNDIGTESENEEKIYILTLEVELLHQKREEKV